MRADSITAVARSARQLCRNKRFKSRLGNFSINRDQRGGSSGPRRLAAVGVTRRCGGGKHSARRATTNHATPPCHSLCRCRHDTMRIQLQQASWP